MAKKTKLQTPAWILEGYNSEAEYNKKKGISKEKKTGRTFKIRECPKCKSDDVAVLLVGEEGKKADNWECKKCKWTGKNIIQKELSENELIEYMDEKDKKDGVK